MKEQLPSKILNKIDDEYLSIVMPIIKNDEFIRRKKFNHHENRSVYGHSLLVSVNSYYLAKKLGFDAIKISGKVGINKEDHAWNMVKINDNWYHIDCTWDDDPSNRYTYFLLFDEELNFLRYNEIREYSQDIPVPKAESSLWNK